MCYSGWFIVTPLIVAVPQRLVKLSWWCHAVSANDGKAIRVDGMLLIKGTVKVVVQGDRPLILKYSIVENYDSCVTIWITILIMIW